MLSVRLNFRQQKGFSLIELMVVVALLGIIAALGVPSYTTWIQNTRIRNAAESIQNGMQIARAEAVKRNSPVQLTFDGNSAWTVGCVNVVDPDCPAVIQRRVAKEGSSADVTVVATDAGPYVFNNFGALTSPAPSAADGLVRIAVDISPSVLASALSRDLSIIIGVGGGLRMCDPNLDSGGTDPRKCPA